MKILCPIVFLLLSASLVLGNGGNAGLQLKITARGLELIKRVGLQLLQSNMPSEYNVPSVGAGPVDVENIKARNFHLGEVTYELRSPNVFVGRTSGAAVHVDAEWEFEQDLSIFGSISHDGDVSASASSISLSQEIVLETDDAGKPKFGIGACNINIGRFRVDVSGLSFLDRILNPIVNLFDDEIANALEGKVCDGIRDALQNEARKINKGISMMFPFAFGTRIDLRFLRNPSIANNGLTAQLRCRVFSSENPTETCGTNPPEVPDVGETNHMMRISIGEYVLNNMLCALFTNGKLSHTFSHSDINSLVSRALSVQRLAFTMREVKRYLRKIPRTVWALLRLQIVIAATEAPSAIFSSDGVAVNGRFSLTINVVNGEAVQRIASVNMRTSGFGQVLVDSDGEISANITFIDLDLTSRIRGLPTSDINSLFDAFLPRIFVPALNNVAKAGFKLPGYFNYRVVDLEITHQERALDIQANFAHD